MNINFLKYQGAGNDFILIDNRSGKYNSLNENMVKSLCDRRFGIGADGLMLLSAHQEYDFEMAYYNADGRLGSMCGNGGRCIVAFAQHLKVISTETTFLAVDGMHFAKISDDGQWVELQMIDVDQIEKDGLDDVLNTGSPHYVRQVTSLKDLDVYTEGYQIRNNDAYKQKGINVNFVEEQNDGYLFVRTFERGVEDETYACGTGVTAVAMAIAQKHQNTGAVRYPVRVMGGELEIRFDYDGKKFTNVFLCGPAKMVFEGVVDVNSLAQL